MKMFDYREDAKEFIRSSLSLYLRNAFNEEECVSFTKVYNVISRYNTVHRSSLKVSAGFARVAIIGYGWVIKLDQKISCAGNCQEEVIAYEMIKRNGFSYLFAEPTSFFYQGHTYYIYPKIENIDPKRTMHDLYNALDEEESEFLDDYFSDLHGGNFGFDTLGNPIIIDYASNWLSEQEDSSYFET